ncbi:MAG: cell division protein FtsQ [Clostridia bacterium]|nr:cell division protein FtsQ [Clostridia bacterium]
MAASKRLARRRRKRGRKLLLFLLSVVALYFFFNSSFFSLADIEVEGAQKVKPEEIRSLAGVNPGVNLWHLELKKIEDRLATHPLVDEVSVRRLWPRGLIIRIKERQPLAMVNAPDAGFLVLDAEGVVMQRLDKVGQMNLPLITGVKIPREESGLGAQVKSPGLHESLAVLTDMTPNDRGQVIEINCTRPEDLRLFLAGGVEVRFGDSSRVREKLDQIREILTQAGQQKAIAYIDVSFVGPPVIKFRP